MAPEVIKSTKYDHKCDVYSGIIMFQILPVSNYFFCLKFFFLIFNFYFFFLNFFYFLICLIFYYFYLFNFFFIFLIQIGNFFSIFSILDKQVNKKCKNLFRPIINLCFENQKC
jgi:hypothetical protein